MPDADWNPARYSAFRSLRLRPALDLMLQVPELPPGPVVDLGCGDGAAAEALRARFAGRRLVGLDASPAMMQTARGYDETVLGDAATWAPPEPPALIFSNAALHWLPDHAGLLPRLAGLLAPGGTLAVQMPRQWLRPSHQLMRDVAAALYPHRFDFGTYVPPTGEPAMYERLLAPLGALSVWETEYLQRLGPEPEGHPVRAFTRSTGMRPITAKLSPDEEARYLAAYDAALASVYPPEADGGVLFPFRRLFFVLTIPA